LAALGPPDRLDAAGLEAWLARCERLDGEIEAVEEHVGGLRARAAEADSLAARASTR
jgi:hypothetical protein